MVRIAFGAFLLVHALLHLLGFAKGFGLARLDQLRLPVSRPKALLWLGAAALLFGAVVALLVSPRWLWLLGGVGAAWSQLLILTAWRDARFGTLANAALLLAVVYAAFAWGPFGLRADYHRLVREGIAEHADVRPETITEASLAHLPPAVQRYLRFVGAVGTNRPVGFRARMSGRLRGSATAPWMPFEAEQYNFYAPPRRYFWLEATRSGLPVDGLHAYGQSDASMRIRVLSLFPVVDLHGPTMMRTETVTLLNDMSIFAPGSLLDPSITWRELDGQRVEARFANGPHTISSVLVFDEAGALVDFWSDDRPALAEDGVTLRPQRWSTPLRDYRPMGRLRLATRGEARYAAPDGDYAYLELEVTDVTTEVLSAEVAPP